MRLNQNLQGQTAWMVAAFAASVGCGTATDTPSGTQENVTAAASQAVTKDASSAAASATRSSLQVAEEIRKSYGRSRGGQSEELIDANLLASGQNAASSAGPVGVMYDQTSGTYRFWLYTYTQTLAGIPVHGSELRVLVANQPGSPVVWIHSNLRDLGSFTVKSKARTRAVDREKSQLALARSSTNAKTADHSKPTRTATRFTEPQLVIYAGEGERAAPPRLATKYIGVDEAAGSAWLFLSDAETGDILHSRSANAHDVSGTVNAIASPNGMPGHCGNQASKALPYSTVGITSGTSGFTDANGQFTLSTSGSAAVDVNSSVTGKYFAVSDMQNSPTFETELLTQSVVPPGPATFLHNNPNSWDHNLFDVDAYLGVNKVRDWVLSYDPAFPGIVSETAFPIRVNVKFPSCDSPGWYLSVPPIIPPMISFCTEGVWDVKGTAVFEANGAFGDIAYHEYTHHLVDVTHPAWNNVQDAYGEGIGDSVASLITGRPEHALGIDINDSNCTWFVRTANNTCQYSASGCSSCGDEIHDCGTLLSGIIWSIRTQLQATHPSDYQDIINRLVVGSIKARATATIDATLLTEFLTLDDDDNNQVNGTPHRSEICAGFGAHGIQCPALPGPCASYCSNPTRFTWTGSYQSGNLGTGMVCRETTHPVAGGNCGNFAGGRQLSVNGRPMTCNGQNWSSLPPPTAGGYCVTTTAGNYPWAFFTLW